MSVRLILIVKAPQPGLAKTRLIPVLGEEGSAALAKQLLEQALGQAAGAQVDVVECCVTPPPDDPAWQAYKKHESIVWSAQSNGDLGVRMANACRHYLEAGNTVLLMGTDCPGLTSETINRTIKKLADVDAVLIPALDGGYTLLGLRRFHSSIFDNISWSTPAVLEQTLAAMACLNWRVSLADPLPDIDEPEDLRYLPNGWQI